MVSSMKKFAIVVDGVVVNATLGEEPLAPNWIETDNPRIGWLWDGQQFSEPPPVQPPPPAVVSMRQARLALLQIGKLADVDAAIAALPSPAKEAAQVEWEYATEVRRDSTLVRQLAPALSLDEAALDALFTLAHTL